MKYLERVILHARQNLRDRNLVDLCDVLGVPSRHIDAVRTRGSLGALVGVLSVQLQDDLFDVVEDGPTAAILAAYDEQIDWPTDLVAICLGNPCASYRLRGIARALGEDAIARARYDSCTLLKAQPGTLTVHATALDWLRSGCEGCAILDNSRTPVILANIDQCVASPANFAPSLHNLLYQRPAHLPRVMVPERESIEA